MKSSNLERSQLLSCVLYDSCVEESQEASAEKKGARTWEGLFLFLGCTCGTPKFLGSGEKPHHGGDNGLNPLSHQGPPRAGGGVLKQYLHSSPHAPGNSEARKQRFTCSGLSLDIPDSATHSRWAASRLKTADSLPVSTLFTEADFFFFFFLFAFSRAAPTAY